MAIFNITVSQSITVGQNLDRAAMNLNINVGNILYLDQNIGRQHNVSVENILDLNQECFRVHETDLENILSLDQSVSCVNNGHFLESILELGSELSRAGSDFTRTFESVLEINSYVTVVKVPFREGLPNTDTGFTIQA